MERYRWGEGLCCREHAKVAEEGTGWRGGIRTAMRHQGYEETLGLRGGARTLSLPAQSMGQGQWGKPDVVLLSYFYA